MAVYVDPAVIPYHGKLFCHLVADSIPELHAFAEKISIKCCWFHKGDHYDLNSAQRELAVQAGAREVPGVMALQVARGRSKTLDESISAFTRWKTDLQEDALIKEKP